MSRVVIVLLSAVLTGTVWASASGRIVGPDGAPIGGAEVCEFLPESPERCVTADTRGVYRMENTLRPSLLVRASGFLSKSIDAVPLSTPVRLERAASLRVIIVDADTAKPLASGRVMLDSPSGRRIGDFVPFNAAGVRISTLEPGDVFVRVEADGYRPSGPVPTNLVSGVERALTIRLKKQAAPTSH